MGSSFCAYLNIIFTDSSKKSDNKIELIGVKVSDPMLIIKMKVFIWWCPHKGYKNLF